MFFHGFFELKSLLTDHATRQWADSLPKTYVLLFLCIVAPLTSDRYKLSFLFRVFFNIKVLAELVNSRSSFLVVRALVDPNYYSQSTYILGHSLCIFRYCFYYLSDVRSNDPSNNDKTDYFV